MIDTPWSSRGSPLWIEMQIQQLPNGKPLPPLCLKAFSYYPRLKRVRIYVATHYRFPICLADAAAEACLEPTYFSRYFKDRIGLGFCRWVALFRIAKAVDELRRTECSIAELGERVGIQDIRTLQRLMKQVTGLTPIEVRSQVGPSLDRKFHKI